MRFFTAFFTVLMILLPPVWRAGEGRGAPPENPRKESGGAPADEGAREPYPLIEGMPEVHPIVQGFLSASWEEGKASTDEQTLHRAGFARQAEPGYQEGPLWGFMHVLRAQEATAQPVIGGIRVGDAQQDVHALLGKPHFDSRDYWSDGQFRMTGYRFRDCYVTFLGGSAVEEIAFIRDTQLPPSYDGLLSAVTRGADVAEIERQFPQTLSASHRSATQLHYINGISLYQDKDRPFVHATIYENFQGEWQAGNALVEYRRIGQDFIFASQCEYYKDRFWQLQKAANPSPDGRIVVLPGFSTRPVAGDSFTLHFTDGSRPDVQICTPNTPRDYIWLDSRYLLYGVRDGETWLADAYEGTAKPLSALVTELSAAAGGPEVYRVRRLADGGLLLEGLSPQVCCYALQYQLTSQGVVFRLAA